MKLTFGLSTSSRTRPLADGRVPIAGVEPEISFLGVQALFNHQLVHHTYDVCEFPLVTYLRQLEAEDAPYLAIPVFPSRHFRLSCLFVAESSDVTHPKQLAGRRVGVPTFDMAAAVWLRGMLADHFDLDRFAPTYVIAGMESARVGDEHPQVYPDGFDYEFRTDASLVDLLAAGQVDAVVTARAPSTWPDAGVRRLFADAVGAEREYYAATSIFPAMHVLAVKRPIAQAHPHVPQALFEAFSRAQAVARDDLVDSAALDTVLPWQLDHLIDTERVLGTDYWPVGVEANRHMLDTIIDYSLADGLISTRFRAEDLFAHPQPVDLASI